MVERVEGVFSGTLSYIFNNLVPGQPFSAVVAEAKRKGYTGQCQGGVGVSGFLGIHLLPAAGVVW